MAKMFGVGLLTAAYTLALFYFIFSRIRHNAGYFKTWVGPFDDIHILIFGLAVTGLVVCVTARLMGKTKYGIQTGSSQIAVSALAINASAFVPENYMRPYMLLILFMLVFGYGLWGTTIAAECAQKSGLTKKFAWACAMTALIVMAVGFATIFNLITMP